MIIIFLVAYIQAPATYLDGAKITISGSVQQTGIDFLVKYTNTNSKWLGIIFSKSQISVDMHLIQVKGSSVVKNDAYINDKSQIIIDQQDNLRATTQTHVTSTANGFQIAYGRDLLTGDDTDTRFYKDTVIIQRKWELKEIRKSLYSFKSSLKVKIINSVLSDDDRLIGQFAFTQNINNQNLTIYTSETVQESSVQPWLYLTIVYSKKLLAGTYTPLWIAISYGCSMTNIDHTLIQFTTKVTVKDLYSQGYSYSQAKEDLGFVDSSQGSTDALRVMGGISTTNTIYQVATFKRKYKTGDTNRDSQISSGKKNWCIVFGANQGVYSKKHGSTAKIGLDLKPLQVYNFLSEQQNKSQTPVTQYTQKKRSIMLIFIIGITIIFM